MPETLVLDAFPLLAYFQNEPAGPEVAAILRRAQAGEVRLVIAAINLGEVTYRIIREKGFESAQEALAYIQANAIEVIDVDRELALSAAVLKANHRLGYADCFAAALAQRLNAAIVTGDPDFRQVEHLVTIEWLPTA